MKKYFFMLLASAVAAISISSCSTPHHGMGGGHGGGHSTGHGGGHGGGHY